MSDPVDEAFAAYLRATDEGRVANREEFLQQYPEIADQLSELMDIADSLGSIVSSAGVDGSSVRAGGGGRIGGKIPEPLPGEADLANQSSGSADTYLNPSSPFLTPAAGGNAETVHWTGSETGKPSMPFPRREGESGPTLPFDMGDYRLLEILGRGGMGVVYLAEQIGLGRRVAVKMIRSGILASKEEVQRFAMEAKAAAALEHRNIVSVFQSGYCEGHYYFSMEYVPGVDLAKMIEESPLEPRRAARYVRDVARAIEHAHRRGVLHRDLKPANVLITPDDEVRVTDFGLAKQTDTDSSLTGSGAAVGTPGYMAPEQASGHSDRVRAQCDVYALGALLFAAIAGRAPFAGEGVMQTLIQVIHHPAPPLRAHAPDAPEDLETIIAKCLEKRPEDRYATAAALADELDAFLDERPIAARPRTRLTRLRHWLMQVPVVAALLGRRVIEPSVEHRRFQAAVLALLVILPAILLGTLTVRHHLDQRIPAVVKIAGGLEGGVYDDFARTLGDRIGSQLAVTVEVASSGGSLDNREQLLHGEIHLAPMQAGAIHGDEIAILAPLFFEAVHVMVRSDSVLTQVGDLAGHPVAVGPAGSGSRLATEMVLDSLDLPPETTPRHVIAWPDLISPPGGEEAAGIPEAAIICIGKGSRLVTSMLESGRWRMIPIPSGIDISLQHPMLRPMTIEAGTYPSGDLPSEGISTVGTTAFLVARRGTSDRLVIATLESLYEQPPPVEGLISRERAAEWQGAGFHPAARRFFAER